MSDKSLSDTDTLSKRALISFLCYAFSFVGIFFCFALIAEEARSPKGLSAIGWTYLLSWVLLLVMTISWVLDSRLHRFWSFVGVLLGVTSFLWIPVSATFRYTGQAGPIEKYVWLKGSLLFLPIQILVVSPCFLLAIHLVRFHWHRPKYGSGTANLPE